MTAPPAANSQPRPNFLVIQCDDLGGDDIGLHGNSLVHTPRIDALGRESARFSAFTVNPVCAPSRATFLTGRHFLRTGVSHVHGGKDFLDLGERTLAQHLAASGYATGMWGKWHLGVAEGYHPWQRGFEEAYSAGLYRHRNTSGTLNGDAIAHSDWADAVTADSLIDFMTRHRDRPFFAYWPTMTPHGPHDAPQEWIDHHRKLGRSEGLAKLWGMVSHLDLQIGRVLDAMDTLGLAGNTVVVFMSDNGPAIDHAALNDEDRRLRKSPGCGDGRATSTRTGCVRRCSSAGRGGSPRGRLRGRWTWPISLPPFSIWHAPRCCLALQNPTVTASRRF